MSELELIKNLKKPADDGAGAVDDDKELDEKELDEEEGTEESLEELAEEEEKEEETSADNY
jgi:hypothetical protein